MIVVRSLAFLMFLALALALGAWQVLNIKTDISRAPTEGAGVAILLLALAIPFFQAAVVKLAPRKWLRPLMIAGGLVALPLTALGAGLVNIVQARGGEHRRTWDVAFILGALIGVNLLLPMAAAYLQVGGGPGLALGWMAIKTQFYLAIDYFLVRALVHYFNSGAGTFVSLRYLSKRVISLLSVVGIGAGVTVLILVNSVMTGFQTDFKEQVRGSLSHLLVRFDGERLQMTQDDTDLLQAEWAYFLKRIEASPEINADWQGVLQGALQRVREADGDGLPDARDFAAMQPAEEDLPPPKPEPTAREKSFLKRLRIGDLSGLEREYLRDGNQVTTPRDFYLARVPNPTAADDEARRAWYGPVFRERLQEQFDRSAKALRTHRAPDGTLDVAGVSWRVGTKTFITPRTGTRELSLADLVGVDPQHEPEISNLGKYVNAAEVQVFKDQHVLKPLLNLLGATLGWETEQSLESLSVRDPVFMFTPDGKDMGRMPQDMKRLLQSRDFLTGAGNIRWPNFDKVRYAAYSPGAEIYDLVKQAHKDATRTDDFAALRQILTHCAQRMQQITDRHLSGPEPTQPALQAARMGCRIIVQEFLTGAGIVRGEIKRRHTNTYREIRDYINDTSRPASEPAETTALNQLWKDIDAATKRAEDTVQDPAVTDGAREQALADMLAEHRKLLDAAVLKAETARWACTDLLRQIAALQPRPETGLVLSLALIQRLPVPLTFAVEKFDSGAEFAQRRMEAYRQVLPLRTTMQPQDTIESYTKRALEPGRHPGDGVLEQGNEPGLILGDALAESAILGGVSVGDVIEITIPRVYFINGRPDSKASQIKFRITALFRSGLYEDNLGRMYCDFDELASILADSQVRYYVGARLNDYSVYEGAANADKLKRSVSESLFREGATFSGVSLWEDEKRSLLEAVEREKMILGLIVSFIIVLAGVLILILVFQLVNEKQKDIGILKALGFSPWGIRSVFMFNALFIGMFGAMLGGLAGIVLSEYLNEIEDFIDQMTGIRLFPPDVYFLTYIPSVKGMHLVRLALDIAAPVVLFSFGCGILPAQLAARKDPVEALHYE